WRARPVGRAAPTTARPWGAAVRRRAPPRPAAPGAGPGAPRGAESTGSGADSEPGDGRPVPVRARHRAPVAARAGPAHAPRLPGPARAARKTRPAKGPRARGE